VPDDLLSQIGVRVPDLFAGLAGGVVRTLLDSKLQPVITVMSAITGGLTANYTAQTLSAGINRIIEPLAGAPLDKGFSAFVIGLGAMWICQAIIGKVRRWSGGGQNGGGNGTAG
jgi:hypothetical protein